MSTPRPTCPAWCKDHVVLGDTERHSAEITYAVVWHPFLERDEALAVAVEQHTGPRITGEGGEWTNGRPQARVSAGHLTAQGCRDVAEALHQAGDIIAAAEGGRTSLTLRKALGMYIEDAVPCDDPTCTDGTGPVCDASNLGCQLRRLLLDPSQVHELINAENEWSGIKR